MTRLVRRSGMASISLSVISELSGRVFDWILSPLPVLQLLFSLVAPLWKKQNKSVDNRRPTSWAQLYLDVVVVVVDEREPRTDDLLGEDRHSWRCYRCHCRPGTELPVSETPHNHNHSATTRLGHPHPTSSGSSFCLLIIPRQVLSRLVWFFFNFPAFLFYEIQRQSARQIPASN